MSASRAKIKSAVLADPLTGLLKRPVFFYLVWILVLGSAVILMPGNASAARVDDLYGAVSELPEGKSSRLNAAFDQALSQVLVKVTGLPEMESNAARKNLFPDAAGLVQQYSMLPDNQVQVQFDPAAIRTVLDRAGRPVWGIERPLVAVWLAIDTGGGQRVILAEGSSTPFSTDPRALEQLRLDTQAISNQRGLPIVLPLVDAEDLGRVTFADIWGDFREPVVAASSRYGADAVLIGRSRSLSPTQQGVRWTLVAGDEQASWQGNLASGPAYAAEFLAQRLATYANSAGALRVLITDVDSLDTYGQLVSYFQSLNIIELTSVSRVEGDKVEFELVVRGDAARLSRTLNSSRQLQAVNQRGAEVTVTDAGRLPDLVYSWSRQP